MKRGDLPVAPSVCVTVDYELFGDGSGNIETHLIGPTTRLLAFFRQQGMRATFFVEVAEILVWEDALKAGKGPTSLSRDYDAVRRQILEMFVQGHDVQLHIHPQWFGAFWNGETWYMPSFDRSLLRRGPHVLAEAIGRGRDLLSNLAYDSKVDYACTAFRAGGLHFDRTPELTDVLLDAGVLLDSSVCRGYYRLTDNSNIDYRDLVDVRRPYWYTREGRVAPTTLDALLEVPVWSIIKQQYHKLRFDRLKKKVMARRMLAHGQGLAMSYDHVPRNPVGFLAWLMRRQALPWDFCLLGTSQLIEAFQSAVAFHRVDEFFPLVMIGHSKEVGTLKSLANFCLFAEKKNGLEWLTIGGALSHIQDLL